MGCESCSDDFACDGAAGSIGNLVTQGARIVQAVSGRRLVSILVTTLLQQGRVHFGTSSCLGVIACNGAFGTIGDESCLGERACSGQTGTIGDQSCTKGRTNTVFQGSCDSNKGIIGDGSCTETKACFYAKSTSKIGNDSWKAKIYVDVEHHSTILHQHFS